jgi:L-serine dehydratase
MEKYNSIFDVMGPIMIGPSSSHTAGAARLGKIASYIGEQRIKQVTVLLHGSFYETGKGHGTELALTAGLLGMEPYDERLPLSKKIAKEKGLLIDFEETEIPGAHPNTACFVIQKLDGSKVTVTGSSIGGGAVIITEVNGFDVEMTGDYFTIVTKHLDKKGVISQVTTLLAEEGLNIGNMKVRRSKDNKMAVMILEVDDVVDPSTIDRIRKIEEMISVIEIKPVKETRDV